MDATNGAKGAGPDDSSKEPEKQEKQAQPAQQAPIFSWFDPHPVFVIVLVGEEERPFGIQKDFLCARSSHYRDYFAKQDPDTIEHIVRLPNTPVEVFAFAQNFMYTGDVFPNADTLPTYELLVKVWKLGHDLGIDGLCDRTLEAMIECRQVTQHIPATPLLVQVWKDTPEGSSVRKLLLEWAAEYMRSSDSRTEFARSLPQEVLSELVVAMSSLDTSPVVQVSSSGAVASVSTPTPGLPAQRKNVHYLEDEESDDARAAGAKKQRHSDVLPNRSSHLSASTATKPAGPAQKGPRKPLRNSLPASKPGGKRRSGVNVNSLEFSTEQKLNFCADLLTRMLSGPGFWTRLVGPFKEPVDPATDGVPDYFDKVKRPMDLGTMKARMDRRGYADEQEFLADMHQIFTNCYTYWTKADPMWTACERLERTFEEKYSQMNKWIAKMEGQEEH
ncbi:Homeotic protein female sterile [Pleurostoma richardsiae]|uniref:Homeotic protein female sterile n=1 Tax=Pleurostoma richardsiae TaxID=41990 RepID=A0AA38RPA3_9PEZI|nr:Homeotic protein female sterile [Pleurostoma richardsiae]